MDLSNEQRKELEGHLDVANKFPGTKIGTAALLAAILIVFGVSQA